MPPLGAKAHGRVGPSMNYYPSPPSLTGVSQGVVSVLGVWGTGFPPPACGWWVSASIEDLLAVWVPAFVVRPGPLDQGPCRE